MADEDDTEGLDPVQDGGAPGGAEFVPDKPSKAKSDSYTAMLILAFVAFLAGTIISGREAWEHYDVQFGMFEKKPGGTPVAPEAAPAEAAPAAGEAAPAPATPAADPK